MNYIYIVCGSSGSYDDYRSWNVKGFFSEDKAKEFQKLARDFIFKCSQADSLILNINNNPYDSYGFCLDTDYTIEKIEIE